MLDLVDSAGADLVVLGWHEDLSAAHAAVVRKALRSSLVPILLMPAGRARVGADADGGDRSRGDTTKYRDLSAAVGIDEGPLMSRLEFTLSRRVRRRVQARRVDGAIGS